MALKFVTGNTDKFNEVQAIVGFEIEQVQIDLPEIQDTDAHAVVRAKLLAAKQHAGGEYVVEDTALYFDCLGGTLPGVFVKWFEKSIGINGLVDITEKFANRKAEAVTTLGYISLEGDIHIFEGRKAGVIVRPRGDKDFSWGPIFLSDGETKTYGEMEREEKQTRGMRAAALEKFKEFYLKRTTPRE